MEADIIFIAEKVNPADCTSYRPNSLLQDPSKSLALRLDKVFPHIISTDQTGFIKNRHSFFNIQPILIVLYMPSHNKVLVCVVRIDAEKAFDRVEWRYLFVVLNKFSFGPLFIGWVKLFYAAPTEMVMTTLQNQVRTSLQQR